MAPKKQAKPNGFFLFAQELKSRQGRKFNSMKDACDAAAPLWARMDKSQRMPYDNMAKSEKNNIKASRYTSDGLDVDILNKQEREEQAKIDKMKEDIYTTIDVASKKGELSDELFFLIHVNIFCYCQPEDTYYPAELAVTAFSLKEGIKPQNILHTLVHPGHLPMGYKFEAKQHSDETHQLGIPLEGTQVKDNTEEVFNHLVQFLSKRASGSKRLPILYADEKLQKMIQQILDMWSIHYGGDANLFRVYNLQVMFRCLKNVVAEEEAWPSDTFSTRELEKDVYAYVAECACQLHQLSSIPVYCSRSVVIRYAYIICDNCCEYLGIGLIPGQHVPAEAAIPQLKSSKSSVASFKTVHSRTSKSTKNTGRTKRDYTDEDTDDALNSDTWETESVMSTASNDSAATSVNDGFPLMMSSSRERGESGHSYSNFSDSSSVNSKISVRSYAGVSGLPRSTPKQGSSSSIPAAFEKDLENLSLNSSSEFPAIGRGMRRPVGVNPPDSGSDSDFPVLGRGRGFAPPSRGRGFRKPNVAN